MKYRKKPIEVDAFQFGVDEEPAWFLNNPYVTFHENHPTRVMIITLEGIMDAWSGDMIIKGVQDEIYPCKKDIFDATYDLVEECIPSRYPVIGN